MSVKARHRDTPHASTTASQKFDTAAVATVSVGHLVHDTYPAFLGPLMPLLIPKLGLSLAAAGALVSVLRWSALIQPFLGYWADRTDPRYWVILAPTVTALGMSLLGIAPSYLAVVVLLVLAGLSHAAFHPSAAALATRSSGRYWGRGTSVFMTGGELGRAIGPLFIVAVGFIADAIGLGPTLAGSIALSALSIPFVLLLPETRV